MVFLAGWTPAAASDGPRPVARRRGLRLGRAPLGLPHRHLASASAAAPASAPARPRTTCPTASSAPGSSATIVGPSELLRRLAQRRPGRLPAGADVAFVADQVLLRPQDVQPLQGDPLHAGLPGGRLLPDQGRRGAGRRRALHRLRLLRPGLPVRQPLHQPGHPHRRQVHLVLPPHHQGAEAGLRRGLPDRRRAVRRHASARTTRCAQTIEHERVAILQGHLLTEPQCYYLHLDKEVR